MQHCQILHFENHVMGPVGLQELLINFKVKKMKADLLSLISVNDCVAFRPMYSLL